jgi:hypothetical protein
VARFEGTDGKQVVPFFKVNGSAWKAGAAPPPRPIYGLYNLSKAPSDTPILIPEGEKATDAAQRMVGRSYVCMTWPGGSKAARKADWSPVAGRDVVIWPDADEPGHKAAQFAAQQCKQAGAKSVVVVDPPSDVPDGWDLADAEAGGWTGEQVREWIDRHGQQGTTEQDNQEAEPKKSQAAILIELAADAELFELSGDDIVFATITVDDHNETCPVRAKPFKRWISGRFYQAQGKPPGNQAIHDALGVLEAKAQFEGTPQTVHTRIARHGDAIYIDLCDSAWRTIKITAQGWNIETKPPVKFRRAAGMLPLPDPVRGGSLDDLAPLLNMGEDQRVLALAWLIGAANPAGPYPVLLLEGEQGTGKSTQARILRSVIDPSSAPIRTYPREDRDLMVAAQNGWVVAYDNLSGLPVWLSDALCRLSTGGGFSCRQLYTDADETIFRAMRPVILNGIDQIAHRHDLMDRCITCHLDPIPEDQRRMERELWSEFSRIHPYVLGALCDSLSTALARENETQLDRLPRMADYAHWVVSAEPALPWGSGRFLELYGENRAKAIEQAVETDIVASAIMTLMSDKVEWTGTATELLEALKELVPESTTRLKSWPKAANGLSKRLSRIQTFLRQVGVDVSTGDRVPGTRKRMVVIRQQPKKTVPIVPTVPNPDKTDSYSGTITNPDRPKDRPNRPKDEGQHDGGTIGTDGGTITNPDRPNVNTRNDSDWTDWDDWDDKNRPLSNGQRAKI